MPTLPDLTAAAADLRLHLGDFHARHRADGVFHVAPGGPGSVPALADLDVPELHVDLLPETPDPAAQAVLHDLGYVPGPDGWAHPGGWRLVFPAHDSGWRARQQGLRALLRADPAAAAQYRQVYRAAGREAADQALAEPASARHARVVGWAPLAFVADALRTLEAPWMFAAGAAIDLHLGRVARPHDDLDVVLPYEAQDAVRAGLHARGWRTDAVLDGQYAAWDAPVVPPHHQVHARHPALHGDVVLHGVLEGQQVVAVHIQAVPGEAQDLDFLALVGQVRHAAALDLRQGAHLLRHGAFQGLHQPAFQGALSLEAEVALVGDHGAQLAPDAGAVHLHFQHLAGLQLEDLARVVPLGGLRDEVTEAVRAVLAGVHVRHTPRLRRAPPKGSHRHLGSAPSIRASTSRSVSRPAA